MELKPELNSQLKLAECHPILLVRIFLQLIFRDWLTSTAYALHNSQRKICCCCLEARKLHPQVKKRE